VQLEVVLQLKISLRLNRLRSVWLKQCRLWIYLLGKEHLLRGLWKPDRPRWNHEMK
ncbi:hypothetical protein F2P79_008686, partial [Pimephales promelas]